MQDKSTPKFFKKVIFLNKDVMGSISTGSLYDQNGYYYYLLWNLAAITFSKQNYELVVLK